MFEEENKAIVRRHVEEVFNKGDMSLIDEIISDDYICHFANGTEMKGKEGFKQIVIETRKTFPDIHYEIEDIVAEGNKVVLRYTVSGTQKGEMMGIPPTDKRITWTGVIFYHFKDGKEIEAFPYSDSLIIFQQLGINPPGS